MTMPPTPSPIQTFWKDFSTFAQNNSNTTLTPAQKSLIPQRLFLIQKANGIERIELFKATQKSIILYFYNNTFGLRLWWHKPPQPSVIANERSLINTAKQNNPIWAPLSVPLARNRTSASTTNTIEWNLANDLGTNFNMGKAAAWNTLFSSPNINRLFQRACDFLDFLWNAGITF